MNIFVTVLTLAAVFASSEAGPQGRITYGRIAAERQFPYYVGITAGGNATVHCGGAIISNYWVITAAHCVANRSEVTLHFGTNNFFTPELTLTISENFITKHPHYDSSDYYNDIALINTTYIQFTNQIDKVTLPSMRDRSNVTNRIVTAVGWGVDQYGEHDPRFLKFTNLRLISHEACLPYLESESSNNDNTICAMTDIGSTCFGDSGGPVTMARNESLVAIVSFGMSETCALGTPVAFVSVTKNLDWIKSVSGVYRL